MAIDSPPRNLLCLIVARIGDTLLVTPTLRALKRAWPEARLHVVAHPRQQSLLENNPDIDSLRGFTKKSASFRGWRSALGREGRAVDAALVYGADRALFRYARRQAARVIGFHRGDAALDALMDEGVAPPKTPICAVEERALLLRPLDVRLGPRRLVYRPYAWERAWAETWLQRELGIGAEETLIGLQANSFAAKAYRNLPPAMVRDILTGLPERYAGMRILLLGGPQDRANNQAIVAATPGFRTLDLSGRFTLRQNAALMGQLGLYIGVDTGPTHLAGCFDIPMVALYHCQHQGRNLMPLDHLRCAIVEHPQTGADCPEQASLADLSMDQIHAAIAEVAA